MGLDEVNELAERFDVWETPVVHYALDLSAPIVMAVHRRVQTTSGHIVSSQGLLSCVNQTGGSQAQHDRRGADQGFRR